MKKLSQALAFIWYGFIALPVVSLAQGGGSTGGGSGGGGTGGSSGGGTTAGGGWETLQNPLGNITLQGFFIKIIQILIIFAVPIIVFFIILAGFKYVTARGNMAKVGEATQALTWAIVGGVLILGAEALLYIIQNTVNAIR